jgi:hypothetical protein
VKLALEKKISWNYFGAFLRYAEGNSVLSLKTWNETVRRLIRGMLLYAFAEYAE